MHAFDHLLNAFVFFFIIIDPIAAAPIFLLLTRNETLAQRRHTALKACTVALCVMVLFGFFGEQLLRMLNISTPALQIAGGLLLLIAAIQMVTATHTDSSASGNAPHQDVSVFPLAIPLISGPGALTAVVMKMRETPDDFGMQMGVISMAILVIGITYICFYLADSLVKVFGATGANVLARVFGIILAALAVQFILNGILNVVGGF